MREIDGICDRCLRDEVAAFLDQEHNAVEAMLPLEKSDFMDDVLPREPSDRLQ